MADIRTLGHFRCIKFAVKTGPATTGVVLALGTEQRMFTTDTLIVTVFGMITVLSAEWCFGAGFAGYTLLFGIQFRLPLIFALGNFFHRICHCKLSFMLRVQGVLI